MEGRVEGKGGKIKKKREKRLEVDKSNTSINKERKHKPNI